MKIAEVTNQLTCSIPLFCDNFSTNIDILTATGNGNSVTIKTDGDNNLSVASMIVLSGVVSEIPITNYSGEMINGFSVLSITTNADHDLTLNKRTSETVFAQLNGINAAWDKNLQVVEVSNRNNFKVVNGTEMLPTFSAGAVLEKEIFGNFDGLQFVDTIIATDEFTYTPQFDIDINGTGGSVRSKIRISSTANFERAVDQYTNQNKKDFWMFVHPPASVDANKARGSSTDINNESLPFNYFEMEHRDGFIILVFANTANEFNAVESLDIIRNDVFNCILKSVRGFQFESGFTCESNQVADFLNHGVLQYEKSLFVYQFVFEMPLVLVNEDGFTDGDRAFRDIDLTTARDINEEAPELTIKVDLDDEPIIVSAEFSPESISNLYEYQDASISQIDTLDNDGVNVIRLADLADGPDYIQPNMTSPQTGIDNIGGLNAISFDGIDDYLLGETLSSVSPLLTIFLVCRVESAGNGGRSVFSYTMSRDFQIDAGSPSAFQARLNSTDLGVSNLETPVDWIGTDIIITARYSLTQTTILRVNGTLYDSSGAYNGALNPLLLGRIGVNDAGTRFLEMAFAAKMIYNRDLTDSEIDDLEGYASNRWSIPLV